MQHRNIKSNKWVNILHLVLKVNRKRNRKRILSEVYKKRHYILIKGSKQLDRRSVKAIGNSNNTVTQHHITDISRALHTITAQYMFKCWWGHGEISTFIYYCWECKTVQPLWKTVCQFLTKQNTELSYDSAIPLLGIHPKELKRENQTDIVHSIIIHNSQNAETTQMSINEWMDKLIVICPNNGIFCDHKKQWSADTRYNSDEPWKHYAMWKKPITKDHILYVSIHM